MVRNRKRENALENIVLRARNEKRQFTRDASKHLSDHLDGDIPPMEVHDPSDVLRLRLERFPDIATERLGAIATGLMIHVENPGEDPLIVTFVSK